MRRILTPDDFATALTEGAIVVALDEHLTTQEAADLLGVSRPTLVKLLDDGAILYTRAGTHRRVALVDVLAYREARSKRQKDAFERLFEADEAAGLPD